MQGYTCRIWLEANWGCGAICTATIS